ncbi:hypothetical protein F4780DRAFT_492292 [Xylariomycetidae sp. FL0641]|nr:hypothetical protein F4780DRAFT_492292 [Xylariomycetidae sp. FL0641]
MVPALAGRRWHRALVSQRCRGLVDSEAYVILVSTICASTMAIELKSALENTPSPLSSPLEATAFSRWRSRHGKSTRISILLFALEPWDGLELLGTAWRSSNGGTTGIPRPISSPVYTSPFPSPFTSPFVSIREIGSQEGEQNKSSWSKRGEGQLFISGDGGNLQEQRMQSRRWWLCQEKTSFLEQGLKAGRRLSPPDPSLSLVLRRVRLADTRPLYSTVDLRWYLAWP